MRAAFEASSRYATLRLNSWVVVDFRRDDAPASSTSGTASAPDCKVVVVFSGDFSSAVVKQAGVADEEVALACE